MAEDSGSGGAGMGVIVGVLLVLVVAIVAFFAFNSGMLGGGTKKVDVNVSAPSVPTPK
jgi:predicted metalloprotease